MKFILCAEEVTFYINFTIQIAPQKSSFKYNDGVSVFFTWMWIVFCGDVNDFEDISEQPIRIRSAHVVNQNPASPILCEILPVFRSYHFIRQFWPVKTHLVGNKFFFVSVTLLSLWFTPFLSIFFVKFVTNKEECLYHKISSSLFQKNDFFVCLSIRSFVCVFVENRN